MALLWSPGPLLSACLSGSPRTPAEKHLQGWDCWDLILLFHGPGILIQWCTE